MKRSENELGEPEIEKKRLDLDESGPSTMSGTANVLAESEPRLMRLSIGDWISQGLVK
jgi:hypothetical protein